MEAPRPLSRSRRRTARNLARGLCLGALSGVLFAALPAATGDAAGGSAVVIAGPGAVRYELASAELASAAGSEAGPWSYTVRAHPGEAGETFTRTGAPVLKLIEGSGTAASSIGYVIVPRADGTSSYLPATDFTQPPEPGQGPTLVSADSECIRFVRPLFGPDDANAEDNIATCGAPLTITVREGRILTVHASASSTAPEAGATVQFGAAAEGAEEGEAIEYRWSFGDGTSATGATASHSFAAPGSYRVTVAATGSAESGGESTPLTIVVDNPATTGTSAGAETAKKPKGSARHRGAGKGGKGGSGSGDGKGGSGSGSGKAGTVAAGGGESAAAGTATDSPVVPPAAASTEPAPAAEAAPPVPQADQAESAPAAPPHPGAHATEPASTAAPGRTVRGRLVADFVAAGAEGGGEAGGADSGSESFAAAPHGGSGSVPVAALVAAALLAAGAALEWRGRSPQRRILR